MKRSIKEHINRVVLYQQHVLIKFKGQKVS